MRDLVVSFYNEDIGWLNEVTNHRLFLYDKSGMDYIFKRYHHHIRLPNIGRESHTYAYHIATNYESLAEWTIFTQGWPFDHCYYFLNILAQPDYESMIKITESNEWKVNSMEGFLGLGGYATFNAAKATWAWPEVLGSLLLFQEYCGWLSRPLKECVYSGGALLVVHKDIIHLRKKSFYEGLIDLHQKQMFLPWILEATWREIFSRPKIFL